MNLKLVGKRIKMARENKGFTQEELADAINMSPMHISVIERGAKAPKLDTFVKIANILDVSADTLLQDVVNCSLESRTTPLYEKIKMLPEQTQKWFLDAIDSYAHSHLNE